MARYICRKCNYQFTPKTGKIPNKCPYCSDEQQLVKDVNIVEEMERSNWEI
ncbi:hypothetical protein HYS48_00255 [Candidatus Woesearchaeota archaeon]|nr:hypothetical protein [Candidatus Woesearchaeota archaeon]